MAGKTGAKRGGKRGKSGNKAVAQSVSHKSQNAQNTNTQNTNAQKHGVQSTQHVEPFRVKELKPDEVFMTELDTYLFGQGTHYEIYNKMGAHPAVKDGVSGVNFVVWAPAAKEIYVVGDFNSWNEAGYRMTPVSDGGVYESGSL